MAELDVAGTAVIGVWAAGQMGWKRLLFVPALFPSGEMAEKYDVPQRLVVSGPYRYVRNPLYVTDMTVIASTALLTQNWFLVITLLIYIAQLVMQLRLEERELRNRFGAQYERYLKAVPRFIPRLTPVDPKEIYGE
jgi:protein-S-isoprenylcysteine O-methyltransferase Ste14